MEDEVEMRWRGETWLCLLLATSSLLARTAQAESASGPDASPCSGEISSMPASGTVPANLPRIVVTRARSVSLIGSDGHYVPLDTMPTTTGIVLLVREPLVVGQTYELRDLCPMSPPVIARYVATEPVPLPAELGTLRVVSLRAHYAQPVWRDRRTFLEVELVVDPSVIPWLDAYDWQLVSEHASGSTYTRWRSLRDGLTSQLEISCPRDGTFGLMLRANASHTSSYPLATDLSTTLSATLRCEDAVVFDPATGRDLTAEEIAEIERVARETDGSFPDAAYVSIDGGSATMPTEPDTNGHCSASVSRPASAVWLALSLLGAVTARRRVVRQRRCPTRPAV